jgi:hypothetical protein
MEANKRWAEQSLAQQEREFRKHPQVRDTLAAWCTRDYENHETASVGPLSFEQVVEILGKDKDTLLAAKEFLSRSDRTNGRDADAAQSYLLTLGWAVAENLASSSS